MSSSGAKVRAVAAEIVDAVLHAGRSLDATILEYESRVAGKDQGLLRMMCFGCLRQHWLLQHWADQLLSKPLRKRDQVINSLLLIGLYQMVAMRVPDHAVVSETVDAVRVLKRPKMAGLVNACLRRFKRDNLATQEVSSEEPLWNHPQWMIDLLRNDWPDDWRDILSANNERAPMWLRANAQRTTVSKYLTQLQQAGIGASQQIGLLDAVQLDSPMAVTDLPGFSSGDVSVQDGAAQIAARWLLDGLDESEPCRVLDACAAPGGKTAHLLEIGGENIDLTVVDNDEQRLPRVRENLQRIGRDATIYCADASNSEEWWDGQPFDRILLDAPCSASGVIRRHPDIKLLRRPADVQRLSQLQASILGELWALLRPGGTLLYATCSVLAAENDVVIDQFLEEHGDAVENDVLPNNNIRDLMRKKARGYQILPGTADMDGFYYAALTKKVS